ncbi:hypothetical protein EYF80_050249 [Liparis tanakae]|uniref:Uncharacterized protein n=1 Tax=Liparis tanakae TaxID=230148 RepID=A0A4Z2FFS8_9TELE|nr:hypothetical protein EYF80_050249 [Liparis tanakae]
MRSLNVSEPRGAVWCGVAWWCGVVRCGTVCRGVVRCGAAWWCGVVRCVVAWCGVVWWCGVVLTRQRSERFISRAWAGSMEISFWSSASLRLQKRRKHQPAAAEARSRPPHHASAPRQAMGGGGLAQNLIICVHPTPPQS